MGSNPTPSAPGGTRHLGGNGATDGITRLAVLAAAGL